MANLHISKPGVISGIGIILILMGICDVGNVVVGGETEGRVSPPLPVTQVSPLSYHRPILSSFTDLTIDFEDRPLIVRIAKTSEPKVVVVIDTLLLTGVALKREDTVLRPATADDDFHKILTDAAGPLVVEIVVRDLLDEAASRKGVIEAIEKVTACKVFRAQAEPEIFATLEAMDEDGRYVSLGKREVGRSQNNSAKIRWKIADAEVALLRKLKKSDLRVVFSSKLEGIRFLPQFVVNAEAKQEAFADLKHFIDTVPSDSLLIDLPIGDRANSESRGALDLKSAITLSIQRIPGVDPNAAGVWAERLFKQATAVSSSRRATADDFVAFTLKDHIVWLRANLIESFRKDDLEKYLHHVKERTKSEKSEETEKEVSFFITAKKKDKEVDLTEQEKDELLDTLKHVVTEFKGSYSNLPKYSVKQLKTFAARTADQWKIEDAEVTSAEIDVRQNVGLANVAWTNGFDRYRFGWRITTNPPNLALVATSPDGKLVLTNSINETCAVTPDKDGVFRAFGGKAARYRDDDSIEWYAQGLNSPPSDIWQSCKVEGARAKFYNRGDDKEVCFVSLNKDGSLRLQRENGDVASIPFNPDDPRHATAWGSHLRIQNGRVIRWDGGFWCYHSIKLLTPHFPSAMEDLSLE